MRKLLVILIIVTFIQGCNDTNDIKQNSNPQENSSDCECSEIYSDPGLSWDENKAPDIWVNGVIQYLLNPKIPKKIKYKIKKDMK